MGYRKAVRSEAESRELFEKVRGELGKYADAYMAKAGIDIESDFADRFRDDMIEAIVRAAEEYSLFRREAEHGVETRHGYHKRIRPLRCGERTGDHYGAFQTRWYVLKKPEGWLEQEREIVRQVAVERRDDGWSQHEVESAMREDMLQLIQQEVGKVFGEEPEPYGGPGLQLGRWFSNVSARQVGKRVLVRWDAYQNV